MSKHETGRGSRPSSRVLLSFLETYGKSARDEVVKQDSRPLSLQIEWSVVIAVDASVCIRRPKQHTFAIGNFLTCTNTPPSRKNRSRPIKAWVLLPAQALVEQS